MKRIALWLVAVALLAILASAAMAAPASAEVTIIRDTITTPIFDTGLTDDCRAGVTGTITGTDVVSFQTVETSVGFHTTGTTVDTARIDWSDGSYSIIESIDHFSSGPSGGSSGSKRSPTRTPGTPIQPMEYSCIEGPAMWSSTSRSRMVLSGSILRRRSSASSAPAEDGRGEQRERSHLLSLSRS